jgi:hypothetical protein
VNFLLTKITVARASSSRINQQTNDPVLFSTFYLLSLSISKDLITMNDYMNLQLLQQQQQQRQQQHKMFPPMMGRRASLLACMDEEGRIDPVRYIEYSRMKRANFLYHMNNLFPGGGAANLIPSSSTTTPSMMTMMAMNNRYGGMGGFGTNSRHSSLLMSGLPSSLPGAGNNASLKMDFARTGVCAPRMNSALFDMDTSNTSMISVSNSFNNASPSLQPSSMGPSILAAKQQQQNKQQEDQRQLRQDEYEAAEALLFSMGRAGPANGSKEKREDEENCNSKNKSPSNKADTPKKKKQQRKNKITLPTKKNKKAKKTAESEDEDIEGMMPVKNE